MGGGESKENSHRDRVRQAAQNVEVNVDMMTRRANPEGTVALAVTPFNTMLMSLINEENFGQIQCLLDNGKIQINHRFEGAGKLTMLHAAIPRTKVNLVKKLLQLPGIDVNAKDKDGDSPLILAVRVSSGDETAAVMVKALLSHPSCSSTQPNDRGILAIQFAAAKGYFETTALLATTPNLRQMTIKDIIATIAVAAQNGFDAIPELILENITPIQKLKIQLWIADDPSPELRDMIAMLELLDGDDNGTERKSMSECGGTLPKKTVLDSRGNVINIGDRVTLLDEDTINENDPEISTAGRIAKKTALIVTIQKNNKVLANILGGGAPAKFDGKSCRYLDSGPQARLGDGSVIRVGDYVKVDGVVDDVRRLAKGHGGWNSQMAKLCGQVGLAVNIDNDGDVRVQFCIGKNYLYNAMTLRIGSEGSVEGWDNFGNILRESTPCRVTNNEDEFRRLQTKNRLPYDEDNTRILGKVVKVVKLLVQPYCTDKDVLVAAGGIRFPVNLDALTVVIETEDAFGNNIGAGDVVRVISDVNKAEELQTAEFGGWAAGMISCTETDGVVVRLGARGDQISTSVYCEVKYENNKKYYMNPKILLKSEDVPIVQNGDVLLRVSPERELNFANDSAILDLENPNAYPIFYKLVARNRNLDFSIPCGGLLEPETDLSCTITRNIYIDIGTATPSRSLLKVKSMRPKIGELYDDNIWTEVDKKKIQETILDCLFEEGGLRRAPVTYPGVSGVPANIPRKHLSVKELKLGTGGFGTVYPGFWNGTECAVKKVNPAVVAESTYDEIIKEATVQFNLHHPNIVQLFGISYDDEGTFWMVLQLVDGVNLYEATFEKKVSISKDVIGRQISDAVRYLHEDVKFSHNDIKPQNILIERHGRQAYVCDFGMTRYLGKVEVQTFVSTQFTHNIAGTLMYMAPECLNTVPSGKGYFTPNYASDIWAVGAVLAEMYSETKLYGSASLFEFMQKKHFGELPAAAERVTGVFRSIVKSCLDKDPAKRPSARKLLDSFIQPKK